MNDLLAISDLSPVDVARIFEQARRLRQGDVPRLDGHTCAYSFEGNSLRTRATFLKAMAALGLSAVELPNLLKTPEEKRHLAGYLDQWIDLYVIRESSHAALTAFAGASRRPVINAMSAAGHPCEVLADAFSLVDRFGGLDGLCFCLAGPPTNVLNSWAELCELLGLNYLHALPAECDDRPDLRRVHSLPEALCDADVVLTDAWPPGLDDPAFQVNLDALRVAAPNAVVIPCPPFHAGREVSSDVIASAHFAGYAQKEGLYWVHLALMAELLG